MILALSGCPIILSVTPHLYLHLPHSLLSDGECCWQLCYGFSLSELLSCLSF